MISKFELKEWLLTKSKWPEQPSAGLLKAFDATLDVPFAYQIRLASHLLVSGLLETDLPSQYMDNEPSDFTSVFVSNELDHVSLGNLTIIPLPGSLEVIQKLKEGWKSAFICGKRGLEDWHFFRKGKVYPPWIISLWLELFEAATTHLHGINLSGF